MTDVDARLLSLVDDVRQDVDTLHNPYFQALASKTFERDAFVRSQVQFFSAVTFFGRPMATLASKVDDLPLRTELMRNVWEEHGEGLSTHTHTHTFLQLLAKLGVDSDEVFAVPPGPSVRAFNVALQGACVVEDVDVGLCVMGIIERTFADLSRAIGLGIVDNGWLREDEVVHYKVHESLDIKHADDFFAAVTLDDDNLGTLRSHLQLGAHLFDQLYRSLFIECA